MKIITKISYPNTGGFERRNFYDLGIDGIRFEQFDKSGEMAPIGWIAIYKDDVLIAEIKESVCDIYFN